MTSWTSLRSHASRRWSLSSVASRFMSLTNCASKREDKLPNLKNTVPQEWRLIICPGPGWKGGGYSFQFRNQQPQLIILRAALLQAPVSSSLPRLGLSSQPRLASAPATNSSGASNWSVLALAGAVVADCWSSQKNVQRNSEMINHGKCWLMINIYERVFSWCKVVVLLGMLRLVMKIIIGKSRRELLQLAMITTLAMNKLTIEYYQPWYGPIVDHCL